MKIIISALSLIFAMISPSFATDKTVNYSNISMEEARKKASAEGKLIFVDFHAKWCTPCKWMDQTTFKDENIINTLNADFVSVKIDIDDAKGYEIKKSYEVKYLPTMLIFNSMGQLVDRVEETLSPRMLQELLNKHNDASNKQIIKHDLNVSPTSDDPKKEVVAPTNTEDNMLLSRGEYQKYFQETTKQSSYRVQVGVFATYEAAQVNVEKLQQTFLEPITVIHEIRNGETLFKVRMGQFNSYDEADSFRLILKDQYQMQSIVQ
jgi:thioredoxin 1